MQASLVREQPLVVYRRIRCLVLVLVLGLFASACTSRTSPPPAEPSEPERPQLHIGPLTDYVPAAGLRWMVVGRPAELADNPVLREALAPLIDDERLAAFAEATGIDLRETPSALVAGFDYATLYMARTAAGDEAEQRFTERLASGPLRSASHPDVVRVAGVRGEAPQMFVHVRGQLIAVSVGDPTPARVVALFARRKLDKTAPALEGAALRSLPARELSSAPVRVYFLGPFSGEWTRGARGLLSGTLAAAVALWPEGDRLRVRLLLAGQWEGDDGAHLLRVYRELATSPIGRLLGLHRPLQEPELVVEDDLLGLDGTFALRPLLSGMHAAVAAELREIMDFSDPAVSPDSPRPASPLPSEEAR